MPSEPVLGFDTSGPWIAAALIDGDRLIAQTHDPLPSGQAEALMPTLAALLARAGMAWSDLGALGVGTGPGNFTGVRIAVAAARGLALGLGIPAIGIDRFEAAAFGSAPQPVGVPALRGQAWLMHPGADPVLTETPPPGVLGLDTAPVWPLAVAIAHLAAARRGQPPSRPVPRYLRPADAAPPSEAPPALIG